MSTPSSATAAAETAALWAARLDGSDLSAAERRDLADWLAADPGHRALLSEYCQLSTDLELLLPALVATGGAILPGRAAPRRRARAWYATAAGLAAAAAVAFLAWPAGPVEQHTSLATPAAQRQELTLADGSRIELNAQTSLRVELTATTRRVQLAGGQAFFQVSPDASRPFIVETPAGSVRVTGTEFEVQAGAETALEVLVATGSVQVRPADRGDGRPTQPVELAAGDRLQAGPQGVTRAALAPDEVADALAWRQGQVVFKGTPLSAALARFARYHGVGLAATPAAAELRIGGRFSLEDLDGFLAMLEEILPVRVARGLNGTLQVTLADAK